MGSVDGNGNNARSRWMRAFFIGLLAAAALLGADAAMLVLFRVAFAFLGAACAGDGTSLHGGDDDLLVGAGAANACRRSVCKPHCMGAIGVWYLPKSLTFQLACLM